jgi:hypothetical protein
VYEHDVLLRLRKMFSDPAAARVHPLRRRSYGKSYLAIAGTHLHAGRWGKALVYVLRSVWVWPQSLCYLAGISTRWRRQSSEHDLASEQGPVA